MCDLSWPFTRGNRRKCVTAGVTSVSRDKLFIGAPGKSMIFYYSFYYRSFQGTDGQSLTIVAAKERLPDLLRIILDSGVDPDSRSAVCFIG